MEKDILARYAGWGAIPQVFERHNFTRDSWRKESDELRTLLTPDEWTAAEASTPNAHYTSELVVLSMWKALHHLGVTAGPRLLEPSLGVGNFFGLMPEDLLPNTRRVGVELDSITARIAQQLYPDAKVYASGFQDVSFPNNFFDIAIGNVPFGNYGVHDAAYKRQYTKSIHNYFFIKALDKTRPGGLVAFVTSSYTMDSSDTSVREYLSQRAEFLGAIRLPSTTFADNAGTSVVTDIVFLRKYAAGADEKPRQAWIELAPIEFPGPWGDPITEQINAYFAARPETMLGAYQHKSGRWGDQKELAGNLTQEGLDAAVARLPAGIYRPMKPQEPLEMRALDALGNIKNGAYGLAHGKLVFREGERLVEVSERPAIVTRIRAMIVLREAARHALRVQVEDAPEASITDARGDLNKIYDAFVAKHGYVTSRENRVFALDPDFPLILSLENFDAATKKAQKTEIFFKRTIERSAPLTKTDTAVDALSIVLNERGAVDIDRIAVVVGKGRESVIRELAGAIYRDPVTEAWQTADGYLSGNVRVKLRDAIAAAEIDDAYAGNVEALKAVQPDDLTPAQVKAHLGAPWIPAADVRDFIDETFGVHHGAEVRHLDVVATWIVQPDNYLKNKAENTATYGTPRFTGTDLIELALNGGSPTAYDWIVDAEGKDKRVLDDAATLEAREAQSKLKEMFSVWIWSDADRAARLCTFYNENYNATRLRVYNGSHLQFPGMNKSILRAGDLDKHQKDVVWRILQHGVCLPAHPVGAGKTFSCIASAMELRRLGLAKKPMTVVPNHLVMQWAIAWVSLYPAANILVLDKQTFAKDERTKAVARIATGDYDGIIVSHRSFEFLPVSDKAFQSVLDTELWALQEALLDADAGNDRISVKELQKAKRRLEKKIEDRAKRETKDNGILFEEMGVDFLFVDEADLYKNLYFSTKKTRVAGLQHGDSNRAMDLFIKTRHIFSKHGNRGLVMATATPISNTIAEAYTFSRYLAPATLEARRMAQFDAWAANFGEDVSCLELSPTGAGYRMNTRFAKFSNLPELLGMFYEFADVKTQDQLPIPRPAIAGGKPLVISSPASPVLKNYIRGLLARASNLKHVSPRDDNMLKIVSEGRKAALDMRLVEFLVQGRRG